MRRLPKGVDPNSLPDLAHYRGHGVDRITAWCLTPLCFHQARLTFADLKRHTLRPVRLQLRVLPAAFAAL
jgi:hypothetical protein